MDLTKHWLACYVMLSRARSLDGLLILRPATRKELDSRPPQYLIDEIDRLLKVETQSHEELVNYILVLPTDVPDEILQLWELSLAAAGCTAEHVRDMLGLVLDFL